MTNSPLLPFAYENCIVEHLVGGWTGVTNSPLLPFAYENSIVDPPIGGVDWGD